MKVGYRPGDCVIYAPVERYYGWGVVGDDPRLPLVPCRAFEIVRRPPRKERDPVGATVRPLEGGDSFDTSLEYYVRLMDLPEGPHQMSRVRLTEKDVFQVGSLRYGLFLGSSSLSSSYPEPKLALGLVGITHGQVYTVDRWHVPGKILSLKGIVGAYYVVLFEPAGDA